MNQAAADSHLCQGCLLLLCDSDTGDGDAGAWAGGGMFDGRDEAGMHAGGEATV